MITDVALGNNTIGIFDQRDNGVFTDCDNASGLNGLIPLNFGPGDVDGTLNSRIARSQFAGIDPSDPTADVRGGPAFDNSFARFILDKGVTNRNMPVNRDSFLLISAGEDAIYGTADDVTNWDRD